jgi:hypothetical protein
MRKVLASFLAVMSAVEHLPASSNQAAPTPAELWFRAAWESANELPVLSGRRVEWAVETLSVLTPGEAEALRARISRFPDHPDQFLLEAHDSVRRLGPQRLLVSLWFESANKWRMNRTWLNTPEGTQFADHVWTPNRVWRLTGNQLGILDPLNPRTRESHEAMERGIRESLSRFFTQGLHGLRRWGLQIESFEATGRSWTAVVGRDEGPQATVAGRIEESGGVISGLVDRIRLVRVPANPDLVGSEERFSEHRVDPLYGTLVYKVDMLRSDGRITSENQLERVIEESSAYIDEVTQIPTMESGDILRGPLSVKSTRDETKSLEKRDGLKPANLEQIATSRSASNGRLGAIVMWSAAGIAVALGIVVIRRKLDV